MDREGRTRCARTRAPRTQFPKRGSPRGWAPPRQGTASFWGQGSVGGDDPPAWSLLGAPLCQRTEVGASFILLVSPQITKHSCLGTHAYVTRGHKPPYTTAVQVGDAFCSCALQRRHLCVLPRSWWRDHFCSGSLLKAIQTSESSRGEEGLFPL